MHKKFNNERRGRDISFCYLLDNREIQYLFILTHVALWNGSTWSLKIAYEGIHLRETCGRKSWKNNLMSCYKYSHWDPFMNVNPKYHRQGVRLSLSASLLFEAAWKIQCSIVGFWRHPPINDVTLNASITLDVIVNIWQKLFLLCERHRLVNWLSTDPRSAPCDCNMLQSWAKSLTVRANGMAVYLLLKPFHSNVCFFQCRRSGSQMHSNGVGSNENSRVDGLGKCSILDRIAVHHSHHSRR